MTDFTLTTGDDSFVGGNGDDLFSGPAGGTDDLRGRNGADVFEIQSDEHGRIDGGAGNDTVRSLGFNLGSLNFSDVEALDLASGGISATAAQLSSFAHISSSGGSFDVQITLTGPGGAVDFGATWTGDNALHIDAFGAGGGFTITGTDATDFIAGSDFDDSIYGGGGNDRITGRGGSADLIDGGDDNDVIQNYSSGATLMGGDGDDKIFAYAGDVLDGGDGKDKLHVKLGGSVLDGGGDADKMRLGLGIDTVAYTAASDSDGHAIDQLKHFDASADKIDLWFAVDGVDATQSASGINNIADVMDADHLAVGHAALATVDAHTYLVVDANGVGGYQAGEDLIVRMDGVEAVTTDNFI